jgi:hypothetical protein
LSCHVCPIGKISISDPFSIPITDIDPNASKHESGSAITSSGISQRARLQYIEGKLYLPVLTLFNAPTAWGALGNDGWTQKNFQT